MVIVSLGPILPGDVVSEIDLSNVGANGGNKKVIVGAGLSQRGPKVFACKAGLLYKKDPGTYWVDGHQKRYTPVKGELVIGCVVNKFPDYLKVDIGCAEPASLSCLAFENATKKNKPNLKVGDLVYARLLSATEDSEPELVCVDSHGRAGRLGALEDGLLFSCGLHLVRRILDPKRPLLTLVAAEIPFEMAAGLNGKIWVKAASVRETVAVGNALLAAEFVPDDKLPQLCRNIATLLAKFK